LQEEHSKLQKSFDKLAVKEEELRNKNKKDLKEIEKLKAKTDILTREKEELNERVNTLNKEIGKMNQTSLKKQDPPTSGTQPAKVQSVSRSTDVLGMKLKKFGVKPAEASPK
jgi:chromosome segregation ATPase